MMKTHSRTTRACFTSTVCIATRIGNLSLTNCSSERVCSQFSCRPRRDESTSALILSKTFYGDRSTTFASKAFRKHETRFCIVAQSSSTTEEPKGGFLGRLFQGLSKTREALSTKLEEVIERNMGKLDEADNMMEQLEEVLLTSDLGPTTVQRILADLQKAVSAEKLRTSQDIRDSIKATLMAILTSAGGKSALKVAKNGPTVYIIIGVNGAGKTTTIGKLAYQLQSQGKKVLLAAGDTFRAAAGEQLETWAGRAKADIVGGSGKASQVIESALNKAIEEGTYDVVIADTSGRLHTNYGLMIELKDIADMIRKKIQGAPHEILLVLDGTTGQNAINQTKQFKEVVGVTGLIVTKLDGTAKGGALVSIVSQTKLPVKLIGVGEGVEDLQQFDAASFVDAVLSGI